MSPFLGNWVVVITQFSLLERLFWYFLSKRKVQRVLSEGIARTHSDLSSLGLVPFTIITPCTYSSSLSVLRQSIHFCCSEGVRCIRKTHRAAVGVDLTAADAPSSLSPFIFPSASRSFPLISFHPKQGHICQPWVWDGYIHILVSRASDLSCKYYKMLLYENVYICVSEYLKVYDNNLSSPNS